MGRKNPRGWCRRKTHCPYSPRNIPADHVTPKQRPRAHATATQRSRNSHAAATEGIHAAVEGVCQRYDNNPQRVVQQPGGRISVGSHRRPVWVLRSHRLVYLAQCTIYHNESHTYAKLRIFMFRIRFTSNGVQLGQVYIGQT